MADWYVLGLDGDPTPGDPKKIGHLGWRLRNLANLTESGKGQVQKLNANESALRMEGDFAPKFREMLGELPGELGKLVTAYRNCGKTLSTYSTELERAKGRAGRALRAGTDADRRYTAAISRMRSQLAPDKQGPLVGGNPRPRYSDVDRHVRGLDGDVKDRVLPHLRSASTANGDLDSAKREAGAARGERNAAVAKCARGIKDALEDSGIKNKNWLQKAADALAWPFKSWDNFVKTMEIVGMVAAAIAMFVPGLNAVVAAVLLVTAMVAGAIVLADSLMKYRRGEASLGQVLLDAVGVIPGGKFAKLGKGALALGNAGKFGKAGTKVAGLANKMASSKVGRSISDALGRARNFRAGAERELARDPRILNLHATKDPIDLSSGAVIYQQTDFELPGILPLAMERTHVSTYRVGRWFGPSWSSILDQRLEVEEHGVLLAADGCVLQAFPHPDREEQVYATEGQRRTLCRRGDQYTVIDSNSGRSLHFRLPERADGQRASQENGQESPILFDLIAITDRNGNRIDLWYGDDGVPAEVRHSGGYRLDVSSANGRITGFRLRGRNGEPDFDLIQYNYDEEGNLAEVINSSGRPLRYSYDRHGRMIRWEDRNGNWYEYTYDVVGRCIRGSGIAGIFETTIDYDPTNHIIIHRDSLGNTIKHYVNDSVQVIRRIDSLGNETRYTWDRYDRLLSETGPLDRTIRYSYDEAGNLISLVRPDGAEATMAYNELGLPVMSTHFDGTVWHNRYDEHGNRISLIDPIGAKTTFAYDEYGRPTETIDALGEVWRIESDSAGLPIALTDPLGNIMQYERDSAGRIVVRTDPMGRITRFGWTVEGKLIWTILPDDAIERWEYNPEGNLTAHIDPAGGATRFEHTCFDLPRVEVGPDGAELEFQYDSELRLTTVVDPRGLSWRYEYDPAGKLIRETDFNDRTLQYFYDAAGQLVERVNGAGQVTRYVHDQLGNVVERRCDETVATFTYDAASRLIRAVNADADVVFERDQLGRVVAEICNGRVLSSTYDALGRRVRRRTPSGAESSWCYDPAGRPTSLQTAGREMRFAYDRAGREVERRVGAGLRLAQTWDAGQRLAAQVATKAGNGSHGDRDVVGIVRRTYTYRPDGHVTRVEDSLAGTRDFDIDPAGRVTSIWAGGWTERYAYDLAGSVTDASWADPTLIDPRADAQGSREYLGARIRRAGGVRYEHDTQGRVVLRQHKRLSAKPETWRYVWDADDRLIVVVTPDGQHWRYRYDALGRRIGKEHISVDDTATLGQIEFTWDGMTLAEQTSSVQELVKSRGSNGRATVWNWMPDGLRPVSQTERVGLHDIHQQWIDREFYAIVTDLMGTPTELVDPAGKIAWKPRFNLWGADVPADAHSADCPLRFPGQYVDEESGLHYNYFRYYDPTATLYLSCDPLGLSGGWNPQTYVANPMFWMDPLGLSCQQDPDVVLGMAKYGTRDLAEKLGASHFLDLKGGAMEDAVQNAIKNPDTRLGVNLNGFHPRDGTVEDQVAHAVETGNLPFHWSRKGATNWEMALLERHGRLPDVSFFKNGERLPNPFS